MRMVGSCTRMGACVMLLMSHALLLYALSYGQVQAGRWPIRDAAQRRVVVALPCAAFVAAATQRVERLQPQLFPLKAWWAVCTPARSANRPTSAVASRVEARRWCLPQPLATRAGEVLRL